MRTFDKDESEKLIAQQWQLNLLELNPSYVYWGVGEDYMTTQDRGWETSVVFPAWRGNELELDDMNECVHFYFSVNRDSKECPTCGGEGYHPEAHEVTNGFYTHMNQKREHWNDKITQDEVQALLDSGRLCDFTQGKPGGYIPNAEEVNAAQGKGMMGHDAINRMILIRQRLKRLGLPNECPECDGNGRVYTAPEAHVSLTIWVLHPRKGAARGFEYALVNQADLPSIFAFLRKAAKRNAERFSKIQVRL